MPRQLLQLSKVLAYSVPLLGLTVLSLAGPVHAQTSLILNTGDSLTVDGSGTNGVQNSMTVMNTTTSYSDADGNANNTATGLGNAVQLNDNSQFTLGTGGSLTSGDTGVGNDAIDAYDTSAVTIRGGTINIGQYGYGVYTESSGAVTVSGGTINAGDDGVGVFTYGTGTTTISGGTTTAGVYGVGDYADGSGATTISGGTLTTDEYGTGVVSAGTGMVTVSGGEIIGGLYGFGLVANSGSAALVTGGTITSGGPEVETPFGPARGPGTGIYAGEGGTVTITGGNISGSGDESGLQAGSGGIINLFSLGDSAFTLNGTPINNTSLMSNVSGTLIGTLLDGEALDTTIANGGTFNFNVGTPPPTASAAPEPAQTASLVFVGLGLGGLITRARRRHTAAASA